MKKLILAMLLVVPAMLFAEKTPAPAASMTNSWTNKMNTPFFVTCVEDKSDYDGKCNETKNKVEKFLGENGYRYKTEKDGTAFTLQLRKTPKDRVEIQALDESTKEGLVAATEDGQGKDTIKKFTEVMKLWDKNGALYKVVFQGLAFKEIQAIKAKITADPNYGGQWQPANESVLLTYKSTADVLVDAVVKAFDGMEPLTVEGRKIIFKYVSVPEKIKK